MRRIGELFMAWPFLGPRRMVAMPRADGHAINRKRFRRGRGHAWTTLPRCPHARRCGLLQARRIILDIFAGSGTTLIAAEKAARRGYGMVGRF
jgi:hypothetical protein